MRSLTFIILLLIGCNKKKSELYYMNLYSTTIVSLNCENLKKSSQLQNLILSNKKNDDIRDLFLRLKPLNNNLDIDARIYGVIYNKSERLDFCMSTTVIEINNKKYFVSDQLRKYMTKLTIKN